MTEIIILPLTKMTIFAKDKQFYKIQKMKQASENNPSPH